MHREPRSLTEMQERGVERSGGRTQHQRPESMCDGLWSKLPSEVLERVLPFLPVPDLCRYRSVCKRWNSHICTPEFGTLCVQNASNGVSKGECFVVKHLLVEFKRTCCRVAEVVSLGVFVNLDTTKPQILGVFNLIDRRTKVRSIQGVLYVLFAGPGEDIYRLYSYNCVADAWEDCGVRFREDHIRRIDLCDLVVSNNCLFCCANVWCTKLVAKRENTRTLWPLDISEILLADQVCRTVQMTDSAEVRQNFDVASKDDSYYFGIRAYGFDKSILLTSKKVYGNTGKYMLYNVVTGLWEFLPPNPAERLHFSSGYRGSWWKHGERMRYLRLPNTPWG